MKTELAKQLRNAGFPQEGNGSYRPDGFAATRKYAVGDFLEPQFITSYVYIPTLSELIEACGPDFFQLTRGSDLWYAEGDLVGTDKVVGETPEEAMAKLYIALKTP